jgi:uncharacterized membrane protein
MAIAITLHLLATVVWVGGMFFAHLVLRPAALALAPAERLALWARVFARFFPWVWAAVALLLATGYWMIFAVFEGMANVKWHVHVMQALGLVMAAIFLQLYFAPYQRFRRAVAAQDWSAAGTALAQIRLRVGTNLVLGLTTTVIATGGAYLF